MENTEVMCPCSGVNDKLRMLFNDAINCCLSTVSVVDGRLNIEQWWSDTDRGKCTF
jgi:hypothetical protein